MSTLLDEIVKDLAAEHSALDSVLSRLSDEEWERPTHAPDWSVRDQVAHLAKFDDAATATMREGGDIVGAMGGEDGVDYLTRARELPHQALYEWWREASATLDAAAGAVDPVTRLPWAGRDMSPASFLTARLMECWSHGLDVVDVVPFERPDADRLRHVVQLGIRTRPFSYINRGLEVPDAEIRLELVAPSGARWEFGEEGAANVIAGSASEFCRVVTQRRHLADTGIEVSGPAATEWMTIAQAFAGPPGGGREPGQFARGEQ